MAMFIKNLTIFICVLFTACGSDSSESISLLEGETGANGYSTIAIVRLADLQECPNNGTVVEFYLDKDASQTLTGSDQYLNKFTTCNGSNGSNGTNGTNSTAAVTSFNFDGSGTCQEIITGSMWANKSSNLSSIVRLYHDSANCIARQNTNNNTGRINELSEGNDETHFFNNQNLLIVEGTNGGVPTLTLKKIVFNL